MLAGGRGAWGDKGRPELPQKTADRKAIVEWKLILKALEQKLKDQRVYRCKPFMLRKALCVIRKSVELVKVKSIVEPKLSLSS